jgi:hypothetical protein
MKGMRRASLAVALATGCVADTSGLDGSLRDGSATEVGVADVDSGESEAGVECCPVDGPYCGCVNVGGTRQGSECPRVCDSDPNGWTYYTDPNGCRAINTGFGSCLFSPDAGVPSCTGVPAEFVGEWQLTQSFVSRDSTEYTEVGLCAEIGWDQRLQPLRIGSDGSFSGELVTDYLDTWQGCAVLEPDGSIRLDVHICNFTCYGHDQEPGRLGYAFVGAAGDLVLERRGFALLAVDPMECRGCSNDGTMCEALENAYLRMRYTR